MKAEEIVSSFKEKFKEKVKEIKVVERKEGKKRVPYYSIWIKVEREIFKKAVKHLVNLQFPHFSVISGDDLKDNLELNYHFSLNYGKRLREISISLSVNLPKNNLKIETITDLIPGALVSEREIQEMFGIKVEKIPDKRRMFLSDDFPEGIYPWRKDNQGVNEKFVKKLHEEK